MKKNHQHGNTFLRVAVFIMAILLFISAQPAVSADAAVPRPGNCRFYRWNNCQFTSCAILWNKVSGAQGYQLVWSWTDGSHAQSETLSSTYYGCYVTIQYNHVYMAKVRAFRKVNKKKQYSEWSNLAFITPFPSNFTAKRSGTKSDLKASLKWNPIYGSDGYNVFLTTNPSGTWYWNQSTATKATATSATISKYRGGKLKAYQNYYFRIVTRRKRNGVFCTVPAPSTDYYQSYFWFYYK